MWKSTAVTVHRLTTTQLYTLHSQLATLFLETFIWIPFLTTLVKLQNIHK